MAKVYTTGPAHIYVRCTCDPGPPYYLGTAESAPDIELITAYDVVYNDLGGSQIPFDRLYEGKEGRISAILTRYNEAVLQYISSVPDHTTLNPGGNLIEDVGTLMGSEGATFAAWIQFPYAAKPAFADMPPGYRFWSCTYLPERLSIGTRAKKRHVLFQAIRAFTDQLSPMSGLPTIRNGIGVENARWVLYDFNMTELPALTNIGAAPD